MDVDYSRPPHLPEKERQGEKVAFVLSGGGNQGALEVGVLLALLENGIRPHVLIGTSVGAINAAAIAIKPTLEGARWLEEIWRGVTKDAVMPNNYLSMFWRLVTGQRSIFTNEKLKEFLESHLPDGIRTFGDIKEAELYITAVDFNTGNLHIFGLDSSESLIDAVMASTAIPPFLSPWQYQETEYVDGSFITDLPVRVALKMNTSVIYAINVNDRRRAGRSSRGILRTLGQLINVLSYQKLKDELGLCSTLIEGEIHYIGVDAFEGLRFWDFDHTIDMIDKGRQVGQNYLREHNLIEA